MQICQVQTHSLIEYAFNARKHSDTQIDRIANSIAEFGFNQPIVIDEENIVLVGHGRLAAAKKLGLETVPVVQKIGLSNAQKKAYRILDNKLQNDSEWDFDLVEAEIDKLISEGFDTTKWGLDSLLIKPDLLDDVDIGGADRESDYSRTFTLTREQAEVIDAAIAAARADVEGTEGNANANALEAIAVYYVRNRNNKSKIANSAVDR